VRLSTTPPMPAATVLSRIARSFLSVTVVFYVRFIVMFLITGGAKVQPTDALDSRTSLDPSLKSLLSFQLPTSGML
jgi:hypothetical protein